MQVIHDVAHGRGSNSLLGTSASETLRIGRAADNDIVLDYPMVSNHHARLALSNGRMEIEDPGKTT
ncbi:MAG TPA: FHA domain-containing protein, partial [Gemmataceae bacterium]